MTIWGLCTRSSASERKLFLCRKEGTELLMLRMNKLKPQLVNDDHKKPKSKTKHKKPFSLYHFLQLERIQNKHCSFVVLSKCNWCTVNKTDFSQGCGKQIHTQTVEICTELIFNLLHYPLSTSLPLPQAIKTDTIFPPLLFRSKNLGTTSTNKLC